jgi:hypothetical protein
MENIVAVQVIRGVPVEKPSDDMCRLGGSASEGAYSENAIALLILPRDPRPALIVATSDELFLE